ncbi:uncharacterized protein LOC126746269 isoform X2 [Anthonomus grandis grandis]|uniref:uncharacterized protein LOC126746269 isoform X2 n=1 Tax=Anthonomus grandis grandis TaxID=2921223 RepID=UPI0021666AA1|nr:uncharacterized protein LOC126746269 isoform X2 [Anthonomus grandis grandis]
MKLLVLFGVFVFRFVRAQGNMPLPEPIGICSSSKDVVLQSRGDSASQTVILDSGVRNNETLCQIKVTAPKSHVVNFQFMEEMNETIKNDTNDSLSKEKRPSCVMSIYLPDNSTAPFWKGDPCSGEKMTDIDLLTSEFNILWSPPENQSAVVFFKTVVLTAVGSGPSCKEPFQHTCMRIGRIPMLCISDHLLCDGIPNCPKTSTNSDEDPKICNIAKNAWENFVVELVKKYRPRSDGDDTFDLQGNSSEVASDSDWFVQWQLVKKNVTDKPNVVNETHSASESISAMLNKYGPWGYLMMGLLICGTVLFFCGLWECCCKRPKPEVDAPPLTNPTTVLVMNCGQGAATPPMPPQYDDLDLPPSYTTLFPAEEGRYTSISEEGVASTSNAEEEKSEEVGGAGESVTVQINHCGTSQEDEEDVEGDEGESVESS